MLRRQRLRGCGHDKRREKDRVHGRAAEAEGDQLKDRRKPGTERKRKCEREKHQGGHLCCGSRRMLCSTLDKFTCRGFGRVTFTISPSLAFTISEDPEESI